MYPTKYDLVIIDEMFTFDEVFVKRCLTTGNLRVPFLRSALYHDPQPIAQDLSKRTKMQYGPQKNTRKGKGKKYV